MLVSAPRFCRKMGSRVRTIYRGSVGMSEQRLASHADVEEMELHELIDRLEDLEGKRTPVGWSPDDAVERVAIERRIMALVGDAPPDSERRRGMRLSCDLKVKLRTKEHSMRARVT